MRGKSSPRLHLPHSHVNDDHDVDVMLESCVSKCIRNKEHTFSIKSTYIIIAVAHQNRNFLVVWHQLNWIMNRFWSSVWVSATDVIKLTYNEILQMRIIITCICDTLVDFFQLYKKMIIFYEVIELLKKFI